MFFEKVVKQGKAVLIVLSLKIQSFKPEVSYCNTNQQCSADPGKKEL